MPQIDLPAGAATDPDPPSLGPLDERDLPEAQRIFRTAFGIFLGAPDPENFWSDRDYLYGRWRSPHVAAFAATLDGKLAGTNFATRWAASASSGR